MEKRVFLIPAPYSLPAPFSQAFLKMHPSVISGVGCRTEDQCELEKERPPPKPVEIMQVLGAKW